ncbi:hypothetical protein PR202_ga16876 [Eleusine coracana subsp. coracana]|uniref:Secreted protein n=1 Tax=Eleusine coracana subsp. coracana TaxID=191504 RepID=A0AAV5CNQ4_ELECO|nr:hypothetical protein PR202_ga16876 [Eleusine coracana subsp. coracana]
MFARAASTMFARIAATFPVVVAVAIEGTRWRPVFALETGGSPSPDGQDFEEDTGFLGRTRLLHCQCLGNNLRPDSFTCRPPRMTRPAAAPVLAVRRARSCLRRPSRSSPPARQLVTPVLASSGRCAHLRPLPATVLASARACLRRQPRPCSPPRPPWHPRPVLAARASYCSSRSPQPSRRAPRSQP